MSSSEITVCGGDYEHVLGFGSAPQDGVGIVYRPMALGQLSRTVLGGGDYDAAEYSLANYIMLKAQRSAGLLAIPVFPSRAFRNVSVHVTQASPLNDIASLAGKRVGVSEFAMTTAVWTRGHLSDMAGLDPKSIHWVTGPSPRFPMPAGITSVSTTDDLETLLVEGRIDALMAGRPRDLQRPAGQRQLRCIVDDAEGVERAYFDATGMFPIMHTVVLHERFTNQPALAKRVFDAYVQAKKAALKRRLGTTLLPFADRLWDRFGPPSGDDPYRHGLTELNRKNIATLSRYLFEQGFIARQPEIDALFFDASASWQDE